MLHDYPFPGNVRELRNAIERAIAFCAGSEITPDCLPERIRKANRSRPVPQIGGREPLFAELEAANSPLPTLDEMANRYTSFVLERFGGNKRRAAQVLGITRATLYRRMGLNGEQSS
jgi:DNA-binding NtrC family response regulator